MNEIKKYKYMIVLFTTLLFIPYKGFSQKHEFPKDTIYLKYEKKGNNKKLSDWEYRKKEGIIFNIQDVDNSYMMLFYPYGQHVDTICISELHRYKTLDSKEIRKQEIDWVDRKFKKSKYKPYSGGSRNSVFVTYLIEIISKDKFVIYPVIWRNEGVID